MGNLTLQAGEGSLEISRDPRLGIVAATMKCHAPDIATALTGTPPALGIGIPEWNPRRISRRPAGDVAGFDVTISFEGQPDGEEAEGESFEMEGNTSEMPIETHWNYEVLLKNYKGDPKKVGKPDQWQRLLTDDSGATGRNPMHGVRSYPEPGLIWNRNWTARTLPASLVRELGTLTGSPPGNPPALSGGRVWLVIRMRGKQRGNIWQLQQSWQLSGPYGYVPEMYDYIP